MSSRTRRPRSRVQRLRRWLLASVVLFAALLAGVIGYTRYRALRVRLNLPKKLGIDVKSEADGFTISRSTKDGRPLFTIHASKAIQHTNGITVLHDVAVTIFGPPGSNRTDSIRGGEFEYDQSNQILRAMGETLLDVGIADGSSASPKAKRLTMQGKGLVFLQKLGVASTKEQIRFQYGASQGEAVGSDYDIDTGLLTLQHDVHLHSNENGHPERIDADSAQLDRNTRIATLQNATLTDAADSMQAPHVVAALRTAPDEHAGTLEKVDASGGVILHTSTNGKGDERATAPTLHADVTTENKLAQVIMQGGVHITDDETDATSQRALLRFNNGSAQHLTLTGQAHMRQDAAPGVTRTLDAAQIDAALSSTGGAHISLGDLHATGAAKLVLLQPRDVQPRDVPTEQQTGHMERTELTSPALVAHTVPGARSSHIRDLQASGGAKLVQDDGAGTVRTSTSDSLSAAFNTATGVKEASALESVVQDGHVTIHEASPPSAAQPGKPARAASQTDAAGQHAEFHADTNQLVLTGDPHVTGNGLQLSATRVVLHRDSGDAEATGTVRGNITQTASPTHSGKPAPRSADATQFVCDSAHLTHSTGAVLLQGGSADVRLWSSTGQIEAPSIETDQKANTLHAFGAAASSGTASVKTVLLQQPSASTPATTGNPAQSRTPTRVFSRDLLYRGGMAGKSGTADFRGGVRLLQADDVITADTATATLAPSSTQAQSSGMLASGLQTIVADGHVRVQQGARVGTGTHLLYTASTRNAVLTGTPGALPVVRDPLQGNVTGTELTLHVGQGKGDNQVEVSGAPSAPVHTELDVPERSPDRAGNQGAAPSSPARSRAGRKSRPTP